jgi:hypothetical protein
MLKSKAKRLNDCVGSRKVWKRWFYITTKWCPKIRGRCVNWYRGRDENG